MKISDLVVCDLRKLAEGEKWPAFPMWALGKIQDLSPGRSTIEILFPYSHSSRLCEIENEKISVLVDSKADKPGIYDNIPEIILFLAKSDHEKSRRISELERIVSFLKEANEAL